MKPNCTFRRPSLSGRGRDHDAQLHVRRQGANLALWVVFDGPRGEESARIVVPIEHAAELADSILHRTRIKVE